VVPRDLRRDDEMVPADLLDRLPDDLLGMALPVHLRGVDEVHAALHAPDDRRDAVPVVHVRPPVLPALLPHPEADAGDLDSAPPEPDALHRGPRTRRGR